MWVAGQWGSALFRARSATEVALRRLLVFSWDKRTSRVNFSEIEPTSLGRDSFWRRPLTSLPTDPGRAPHRKGRSRNAARLHNHHYQPLDRRSPAGLVRAGQRGGSSLAEAATRSRNRCCAARLQARQTRPPCGVTCVLASSNGCPCVQWVLRLFLTAGLFGLRNMFSRCVTASRWRGFAQRRCRQDPSLGQEGSAL